MSSSRYTDNQSDLVTDYTLHAGRLKRYATWPIHHVQTVGEHCWQIARIFEAIFGPPRAEIERFIRHHDTEELIVGDPPFPLKKNNPDLKAIYDRLGASAMKGFGIQLPELTDNEKVQVKICDLIEMMEFGLVELEMGNQLAKAVITRTRDAVRLFAERLPEEERPKVERYILQQFMRHTAVMKFEATY